MNICFKGQRKHELVQAYEHIFYEHILCGYSSEEQSWFCAVYVILGNQTSESGEVKVVNYLLSFLTKCISSC
jgi:hypothetical protein